MTKQTKVRTPLYPDNDWVKAFLLSIDNQPQHHVTLLNRTFTELRGTPQNTVSWLNPNIWISERLPTEVQGLASRIWETSEYKLNPRHIYGSYLFINNHDLIDVERGIYQLTDKGKLFLSDDVITLQSIDENEGLLQLLKLFQAAGKAKVSDLKPQWAEYLSDHSNFGTESTIRDTIQRRTRNLLNRQLLIKEGHKYYVSADGEAWLKKAPKASLSEEDKFDLLKDINKHNRIQRDILFEQLSSMNPYQFEKLIARLLMSMGYEDVQVTEQSGDKGVDVVGNVQIGISSVREVVQVKRTPNLTISRPLIDQLRGALPYHDAIRGTLITLGRFSEGAKEGALFPNAAPITLIDGERLLDLLIDSEIGMKKRRVEAHEVDLSLFDEELEL
ncbi:restriction endonuclease [Vibrio parahaemolyticus]|uniref:restriction endonuclease n=1 Tax=Vibrio campbellii TaxID=680 RepID=UPI000680471F|nr:restriction endonuclease [Vibrio campbellii]EGR7964395.1 restriction endonuclease [Vibrio vulnificus]EGR7987244.1 restriction endonuclease [Vibrio vulnificus]EHK6027545.1 restriction endonuclease [Vibrio parahaemolyticus]EIA1769804.1 restriction endonuclease [Vibrio parahaemolyticus]